MKYQCQSQWLALLIGDLVWIHVCVLNPSAFLVFVLLFFFFFFFHAFWQNAVTVHVLFNEQ